MWYMYSGLRGKGIRIDFSQSLMQKFIENIKNLQLIECRGNDLVPIQELTRDKDFSLVYGDILYFDLKPYDGFFRIKYNNNVYFMTEMEEAKMKQSHFKYTKITPWYYEKEFRITITLINDTVILDSRKRYKLKFNLPENILKFLAIVLGPESDEGDRIALQTAKMVHVDKIAFSELKNNIHMDLINYNFYELEEHFDEIFNYDQKKMLREK